MEEWSVISRFTRRPPVDVVSIIKHLGIKYVEWPLRDHQSGYFAKRDGYFEIGVNFNDSEQRKRFTAAHELGHYVLHRDLISEGEHFDRLFGAAARSNPVWPFTRQHEIQANAFAADIIMPADLVASAFRQSNNYHEVSKQFGVSRKALAVRLKNLHVINAIPAEFIT